MVADGGGDTEQEHNFFLSRVRVWVTSSLSFQWQVTAHFVYSLDGEADG